MLIYFEDQKRIINTDQVAWIKMLPLDRDNARVNAITGGGEKYVLFSGSQDEAAALVEQIATAMDRGQEMLWIKPE